jgi:hypothetical protein
MTDEIKTLAGLAMCELIEESRSDECDPVAVVALARGEELPPEHHVYKCLACRYDADLLRQQMSDPQPSIPLTYLLLSQENALRGTEGAPVTFSDLSTGRIRLEDLDSDRTRIGITIDRVSGGMAVGQLALENCREPVGTFTRLDDGSYELVVPTGELAGREARQLMRMTKAARREDEDEDCPWARRRRLPADDDVRSSHVLVAGRADPRMDGKAPSE